MQQKGILVMVNLDTRGSEFLLVREKIEKRGLKPIIMDFSMERTPPYSGDITCAEVADAGGMPIEDVRYNYNKANRVKATENQIAGGRKIAHRLFKEGKIHGAMGAGGATSSLIATSIMKILPFGFPKLMATSMAGHPRYIDKFVGTGDFTMHHTVLDVVGLNPLLKIQLGNAAGAICGMVEMSEGWEIQADAKPFVAVTGFGFVERAVEHAIKFLEQLNYQPVACHSQGVGDRAMDEMIADGMFKGVIDFATGGVSDELFNGNCAGGPNRVVAACRAKIPQIVCPGGLDRISYGGRPDLQERFGGRRMKIIDSARVEVRTSIDECREIGRVLAAKLNEAVVPTKFLYPQQGWSSTSEAGMQLYDPEADAAFLKELRQHLKKEVELVEVPLALNAQEFAGVAVKLFHQMYNNWKI